MRSGNNSSYLDLISFVEDRPGHDYRYSIDKKKVINLKWKPKFTIYKSVKMKRLIELLILVCFKTYFIGDIFYSLVIELLVESTVIKAVMN